MLSQNTCVHDKPAYRLYDGNGRGITYTEMLGHLSEVSVVLFGELHDNPVLQLEVTQDLFEVFMKQVLRIRHCDVVQNISVCHRTS